MGGMGVLGAMGVFGSACPNRLTAPKPLCCRPAAPTAATRPLPPPFSPPLKLLSGAPRPGGAKKTSVSLHHEMPDTGVFGRPFAVAGATFSAAFSAMRRPYPHPAPHKKQ